MSGLFDVLDEVDFTCMGCNHYLLPFGNSAKGYCRHLATTTRPDFGCSDQTPLPRKDKP